MMDNLKYYTIFFILKLIALLPLRILYLLSDLVCFIVHRVGRYRLRVVRKNLLIAFPEKTGAELKQIEGQFYHFLCDCFIESIKLLHISDRQLRCRVSLENDELIRRLAEENRPIFLFMGHYGNWEWIPAMTLKLDKPKEMGALYKPQRNKVMNRVILKIRSRFSLRCIPVKSAYRSLIEMKRHTSSFMIGFIADQRPLGDNLKHWTMFFNRPTAYLTGGETIGDRVDAVYVYVEMQRIKRGYYNLVYHKMDVPEGDTGEDPYTRQFFRMLEASIRRAPAYWLWSHNRWKATPPADLQL